MYVGGGGGGGSGGLVMYEGGSPSHTSHKTHKKDHPFLFSLNKCLFA